MRRRLPRLLLGIALLAAWLGMAVSPPVAAATPLLVPICGPDGLRLVALDDAPAGDHEKAAHPGGCPLCPAPAALDLPPVTVLDAPRVVWAPVLLPTRRAGLPTVPARAPPGQPRAPPTA